MGVLEHAEQNGDVLIVKFANGYSFVTKALAAKHGYGFTDNLRIGMPIHIIGKYVKNTEYTTVIGTSKTAAVFEAVYLSLN